LDGVEFPPILVEEIEGFEAYFFPRGD